MPAPNKNIKLILNYIIGPLVFCVLVYAIYQQLLRQADWKQSFLRISGVFRSAALTKLLMVLALMFANWSIEARKWQLALLPITRISFATSLKAIFSGATMAFFTPNRTGEYFGRILHVEEGKRLKAIALTIVCSIAQLLVTLAVGACGLLYLAGFLKIHPGYPNVIFWINLLFYVVVACCLVLTLFYFRLSWLMKWVEKIPRIERFLRYIRVVDSFNATILLRILSLSFTRYLVFIVQYFLLFNVFEVDLGWWQTFWSVSVVFLVIAIVPSIAALSELGVRWKTSIEVLQLFSENTAGILASSLAVWLINLVIPALMGSLLIFGSKLFRNT